MFFKPALGAGRGSDGALTVWVPPEGNKTLRCDGQLIVTPIKHMTILTWDEIYKAGNWNIVCSNCNKQAGAHTARGACPDKNGILPVYNNPNFPNGKFAMTPGQSTEFTWAQLKDDSTKYECICTNCGVRAGSHRAGDGFCGVTTAGIQVKGNVPTHGTFTMLPGGWPQVECIDNVRAPDLAKGTIYKVIGENVTGNDYWLEGLTLTWRKDRFQVVAKATHSPAAPKVEEAPPVVQKPAEPAFDWDSYYGLKPAAPTVYKFVDSYTGLPAKEKL